MKRILILLVVMLGFSAIAFADNFSVTVTYTVTYEYYRADTISGDPEFTTSAPNKTEVIREEGSTPDEAERKAKQTCSYVCSSSRKIGTEVVNGVKYNVYEKREVYEARATKLK